MKKTLALVAAIAACGATIAIRPVRAAGDPAALEKRIDGLLAQLTLEEKIDLLAGSGFATRPIPRLGIPALKMSDGPVGLGGGARATAFPAGVALAASWDPELVERVGHALGREARALGVHVLLGPTLNLHRVPQGGRNFESFGEDPSLTSRVTVAYVRGVQGEGVAATLKHYACNNQEYLRSRIDVRVDERALHELYLQGFEAGVREAGARLVMSAYNRVNGAYASENRTLLTEILKQRWGFRGVVVSDWAAVRSSVPTANAGLDLEMPSAAYLNREALLPAIARGELAVATIDDKVRRLLRLMLALGVMDGPPPAPGALDTAEHRALAREAARSGIVLLRNERGALPLEAKQMRTLAVIGPTANVARIGGGGSSQVTPSYSVSPLEAVARRAGAAVVIRHARGASVKREPTAAPAIASAQLQPPDGEGEGLLAEYFNGLSLAGAPVLRRVEAQVDAHWGAGSPGEGVPVDQFSARWTGRLVAPAAGPFVLTIGSDDGSRLYFGDKLLIDNWGNHGFVTQEGLVELEAGRVYPIRLEFYEDGGGAEVVLGMRKAAPEDVPRDPQALRAEAAAAAADADAALVFVGYTALEEREAVDRESLSLPAGQDGLIAAVAAANPRTVVVLNTGASVLMPWLDQVAAVVEAWYPGQECGNAIADVLFGDVNPSGKLPTTFLARADDSSAFGRYPADAGKEDVVSYGEGIFIGYRHADRTGTQPLFPFGHGLSYTRFGYSDLRLPDGHVSRAGRFEVVFTVANLGTSEGAEVAQVYVRDLESSLPRPVRELKAFRKVRLAPGEEQTVRATLGPRDLAFYDPARHDWVVEPGRFEIQVGASSRDVRLRGEVLVE